MKTILSLIVLIASLANTSAQGTIEFIATLKGANEIPPNSSPYIADGHFSLNGTAFTYTLGMKAPIMFPTSAGIFGPATWSQNGNLLFDLGNYSIVLNPPPGYTGYVLGYEGALTLTPQHISDLQAGLWYVNFMSSTYPDGEIRGQIVVPEPSALALLALGLGVLGWRFRRRT